MFTTIWNWFTAKQSRTWFAHSIVALVLSWIPAAICVLLMRYDVLPIFDIHGLHVWSSFLMLMFFVVREMSDENKHKEKGDFHGPGPGEDKVSYRADKWGDLVGPFSVWMASLSLYLLT